MRRLAPIAILLLATPAVSAQQPSNTATQQPAPQPRDPATPQPAAEAAALPGHYIGVASCVNAGCHGSTLPLKESPVLQNEYYTWLNRDRHARAYNVLFNAKSARIVRNMHLKRKANEEPLCLDCHSTAVSPQLVSGRIDIEDGVQCEACHGPASGWRDSHTQAGWTHEQSVGLGMTNLRTISTRANVCLSCHLGEGKKEVDHDLIASGHPILAFELDNYTATMPPHWTKGRPGHGVPAWAVGQVAAFRQSLDNLVRHARGEKWPEFSEMSCTNCHHALETGQWRQERGWIGRPGMPSWSPQHWGVLRLIVGRAAPSTRSQLDDAVARIAERVSRMNDRDGVAQAAGDAVRLVDAAMPAVSALSWRDDEIRAFMRDLAGDDDFLLRADVHSAEQTALALQSLSAALTRANPRLLKSPLTKAVDALFEEVRNRDRYEPARFVQKLRGVRGAL